MLFAASRLAKDFALSPIALALLANCAVVPWVHATSGCQVDPTNAPPVSPAGCTASDTFIGWFSPSVLYVGNGGQYVAPAQGLNITHTNQPPPAAAQGGTQGITVYGQDNAAPPNVSSVRSPGAAKVSIQLTNTFTSSSPAVYALTGGRAEFNGDLTVTTSTISSTLTAQALAARGQSVSPLMDIGSLIQVEGVATLDTPPPCPQNLRAMLPCWRIRADKSSSMAAAACAAATMASGHLAAPALQAQCAAQAAHSPSPPIHAAW